MYSGRAMACTTSPYGFHFEPPRSSLSHMLFKVVKAPSGGSPQWVRDAWVGVQFQALQGVPVTVPARASGEAEVTQRRGYPANARDLLGLLALANEDAARWYLDNAPQMLDPKQVFVLDEPCCVAIAELN